MAVTQNTHNGNGSNKNFEYTFQVLQDSDVKAEVDGALTTAFTLLTSPTRVSFTTAPASGTDNVRLFRDTAVDAAKYIFQPGSAIKASDLNANLEQCLFAAQEEQGAMIGTARIVDGAVTSDKIKNGTIVDADVSSTAEIDVNKLDNSSTNRALLETNGTNVQWASNVDIPGTLDVTSSAAFDSNVTISGNTTVGGTLGITGTTTAAAINASGAVGVDGNFDVNTNKFTVAAATGNTVIAGNLDVTGTFGVTGTSSYTGQQTVPGGALVKDIRVGLDGANEVSTASGSLVLDSASGTVQVTDHFNVTGNADVDTNLNVDGTLTVDGTSTLTGNTTVGGTLGVTGWGTFTKVISSNVDLDGGSIDGIIIGAANPAAGTFTTINASGAITGNLTGNASTATSLSAATVITNAEQGSHTANDTTFYTTSASDARYYNINTNEDITSGETWASNDTAIATTKAIDNRIVDIVDDVGGFVALDSEAAIPTNHPEKENATTADRVGTILSIKALSATYTPSGGTCTIPSGTLTNHSNAATITGCGTTVLSSGFGVLVETTAQTDTQYTAGPSFKFHRLVPKATEVTTVAGNISNINTVAGNATNINAVAGNATNINTVATNNTNVTNVGGNISNVNTVAGSITDVNNFADLYQIASSNPSTDGGGNSLAEGDLYFNTSADELKVWNGTAWQGGVTATGNFAVVTGNTWTGDNKYNDGVKTLIGTGSDLEVFHASDVNNIKSVNGKIVLQTTAGNADIEVTPHGSGKVKLDGLSWPTADGSASQVLQTNGSGVLSFATIAGGGATGTDYNDGVKVRFGTDNDLEIYHDGSNAYLHNNTGRLRFEADNLGFGFYKGAGAETLAMFNIDGGVSLYHNAVQKLETTSTGATVSGTIVADAIDMEDNAKIYLGTGDDLQLYHDGTNTRIHNATGELIFRTGSNYVFYNSDGTEKHAKFVENGSVELYYDNSLKFKTNSAGGIFYGTLNTSDSGKATYGASDDLQIKHDGSNSYINHNGGGDLWIQAQGADENLWLRAKDDVYIQTNDNENSAKFIKNGAVELYHDNNKKLETGSYGIGVTGYVQIGLGGSTWGILANDSIKVGLGNDQDLQIYHDGSHSYITNTTGDLKITDTSSMILATNSLRLRDGASAETYLAADANGGVELYYNNTKRLETDSQSINILGDEGESCHVYIYADEGDDNADCWRLKADHSASSFYLQNYAGGNWDHTNIKANGGGNVELYYDNVKKLETASDKILFYGHAKVNADNTYDLGASGARWRDLFISNDILVKDSGRLILGTSADLQLWHDGSNSYIQNSTNNLHITAGQHLYLYGGSDYAEYTAIFEDNGPVKLYHDGSRRFETTSGGVEIVGNLLPSANDSYNLGSSSKSWNNLYVNDLHFSNNPDNPNSVDGTWGDWTLQEGEEDIFMLNNRTGKKYKMALQEVS